MCTPRLSRQSIAPRLLLSLTLALSLLFATASSVLAQGNEGALPASGGTVTFESGVSVKTPDGASSREVTVTYAALEGDAIPGGAPEGKALGSLVFSLDAGGAKFSQLAEVTIPYNADDLAAAADNRDDNVHVYRWDATSGSWLETTSTPNILDKAMTVYQQSLGTYAVVVTLPSGPAPVATPDPVVTVTPDPEAPVTGDFGVGNGMMMGLAMLGMLLLLGGGYVLARNRSR